MATQYCDSCKARPKKVGDLCKACAADPKVPCRRPTKEELMQSEEVSHVFTMCKQQHAEEIKSIREIYELELEKLTDKYDEEIEKLHDKYKAIVDDVHAQLQERSSVLKQLQEDYESLRELAHLQPPKLTRQDNLQVEEQAEQALLMRALEQKEKQLAELERAQAAAQASGLTELGPDLAQKELVKDIQVDKKALEAIKKKPKQESSNSKSKQQAGKPGWRS